MLPPWFERYGTDAMNPGTGWAPRLGWPLRAVVVFLSLLGTCGFDPETCGMQPLGPNHQSRKQVMNGNDVLPGTWPWLVSIQIYTPKGLRHSCGGTIVAARWILTAAHCFIAKRNSLKVWRIVLGATNLSRLPSTVQLRSIDRVIFHQAYNPSTEINDIALIELDSPVTFNDYVQPICLPPATMDFEAFSNCYVSGWSSKSEGIRVEGSTGKGISVVVHEAKANILETKACNSSEWYTGGLNPYMLCASSEDGDSEPCQGDVGELLMCKTLPKSPYYIVGITNSEKDCANTRHPGIYTSIQQLLEWISGKMMGTEKIPEEKQLQNRNIKDTNSASITDLPEETITMESLYFPQETVPTFLEPPYVQEETTPSPPISSYIPTEMTIILEAPFAAADKPFHLRPYSKLSPESADSSIQYRFPKSTALPPPYVPPEAKVTLEPPYISLETPAHIEPPYMPPETSVPLEPPYILLETPASLESPYTPQETPTSLEPPYIPSEAPSPLENPYIPSETSATLEPPYVPVEFAPSLEAPYTPPETPAVLEHPYIPPETAAPVGPPYIPPQTAAPLDPLYTPPETPAPLELPYIPPETPAPLEPPYIPPETPAPLEHPYILSEESPPLNITYIILQTTTSLEPPYIPPESPIIPSETTNLEPPYIPPGSIYRAPKISQSIEQPYIPSEPPYTPPESPYIPPDTLDPLIEENISP